jgi:dTDP-4-dehydrorhamnose 3,5-epimerase
MDLRATPTELPEVRLVSIDPRIDERGALVELYRQSRHQQAGVIGPFVQTNWARSRAGVLRGLHFQRPPHGQGKLIQVIRGRVFDVVVDVRRSSPRFGKWVGVELGAHTEQLWIPEGFAHGLCALEDDTEVVYHLTREYRPDAEVAIRWNDPGLAIEWPRKNPTVSPKDAAASLLSACESLFP